MAGPYASSFGRNAQVLLHRLQFPKTRLLLEDMQLVHEAPGEARNRFIDRIVGEGIEALPLVLVDILQAVLHCILGRRGYVWHVVNNRERVAFHL